MIFCCSALSVRLDDTTTASPITPRMGQMNQGMNGIRPGKKMVARIVPPTIASAFQAEERVLQHRALGSFWMRSRMESLDIVVTRDT